MSRESTIICSHCLHARLRRSNWSGYRRLLRSMGSILIRSTACRDEFRLKTSMAGTRRRAWSFQYGVRWRMKTAFGTRWLPLRTALALISRFRRTIFSAATAGWWCLIWTRRSLLRRNVPGQVVDGKRKAELLEIIAGKERILLEQTIAVGDGNATYSTNCIMKNRLLPVTFHPSST